jgi:uncharacterized protein
MKFLFVLMLFIGVSAGAQAASFDCNRAASADERMVCSDQRLSELDSVAGEAFNRARQVSGAAEITPIARDFLADRRSCGANGACIMASYIGVIGIYRDRGSQVDLPAWATVTAIAGDDTLPSSGLPRALGQCVTTTITRVMPRLDPGHAPNNSDFDSGTAVTFANRGYQVSYERQTALLGSQHGDHVVMCLIAVPHHCPPGDARGRVYATMNLRSRESWSLPDSEHSCGGA